MTPPDANGSFAEPAAWHPEPPPRIGFLEDEPRRIDADEPVSPHS